MDSICRLSRRMGTPVVSVTINSGDWRYEVVLRNVLRNGYVEVLRNGSFPRVSGVEGVRNRLPPVASRVRTRFLDHGWRRRAWIQRGCAGFRLDRAGAVRVARFVCSDSSAASASGGASGSNAPTLSCCSEGPAGCAATRLDSYGGNGLLPTEYGRAQVTEKRGAFIPQKP
jgi:hypothetical protein